MQRRRKPLLIKSSGRKFMGIENVRMFYKGLQIDERTQDYITKRLATLEKFNGNIQQVEVEIDVDKKGKFHVEIIVKTPRNTFIAENTTESIEGCVDLNIDAIQDQITHLKDKLHTLKKRGALSLKKKLALDGNARF